MSGRNYKVIKFVAFLLLVAVLVALGLNVAFYAEIEPLYLNLTTDLVTKTSVGGLALCMIGLIIILVKNKKPTGSMVGDKLSQSDTDQTLAVINSIGEGIIVLDNNKNINLINPKAQEITGWNDDAIGLKFQAILQLVSKDGAVVEDQDNPVISVFKLNESRESTEFSIKNQKEDVLPIRLKINPIPDKQGVVVAFSDISSEVKKNQQQLEFISTASHEMRTPVAAIDGYLSLILNPKICNIDIKANEYALKAQNSSKHLGTLFKNLLDSSKIDDGRMAMKLEVVDMVSLIRQVCQSLESLATAKQLKLEFVPDSDNLKRGRATKMKLPLYAQVDNNLMVEAVSNLIENAIKYTASGKVSVDIVGNKEGEVVVLVQDTGIGIPEKDIPHLFQKFYRVDNRDTREIGGTGLGLYLTRRIIEKMRGKIWVESELGVGSKFFISLRRLNEKQAKILMEASQVQPNEAELELKMQPKIEENQGVINPIISPVENPVLPVLPVLSPTVEVTAPIMTPPPDDKIISRQTAQRLRALGYNTEKFTVIGGEGEPVEQQPK